MVCKKGVSDVMGGKCREKRIRTEKGGLEYCQDSLIEKLTFMQKLEESENVNHVRQEHFKQREHISMPDMFQKQQRGQVSQREC